jgi:hypothetical protein
MNSAQMTLNLTEQALGAVHGTVQSFVRRATADDNKLVYGDDLNEWVWQCPACGGRVVATLSEKATPEIIERDPLCHYCRTHGRTAPNADLTGNQKPGKESSNVQ